MIDLIDVLDTELKKNDRVEVSKRLYEHMMNCLPPREMGTDYFVFQEGDGDRILFTDSNGVYEATLLGGVFLTKDWEYGIRLVREVCSKGFKVVSIFNTNHKPCTLMEEYDGRLFSSVDEAGGYFNLSLR